MSLVGTRPPTVDEWEQYELHHRSRMSTKPGITGMWQVSGRSDITDFEEVVRLDAKGKFSILLESCSLETDKEEVLRYLAEKFEDFVEDSINIESEECNEHQLLAHFWGHLGRLFSQKGALNNFTKAEDCCKKALNYSEKTGSYDYIILHIAGDSISKRIQMILDNIYEYSDLQKNIEVIKEGISEAQEYFNKSTYPIVPYRH